MVALIAVLAPNYAKFVKRSRDAVIENAAESVSESIKMFYTEGIFRSLGCELVVKGDENDVLDLSIKSGSFVFNDVTEQAEALKELKNACGFDGKQVKSDKIYSIVVSTSDEVISMTSGLVNNLDVEVEEVPET